MSNPPNGAHVAPSKRSDRKKNPEPSSVNSHDSSRRSIEEPQNSIGRLAYSSGAIRRLAGITQFFESDFTYDMQIVEETFGAEIERENKIRTLNETIDILTHRKTEETENLRHQNQELLAKQDACQQEQKKCQGIREKLEAKNVKAEAIRQKDSDQKLKEEKDKLHKQFKAMETQCEEKNNKKVRESDEKHVKLSATNAMLERRCSEAEDKLKKETKRFVRLEESQENENRELKEELKQLRAQFPVEGQPVEY